MAVLRVRNAFELQDVADTLGRAPELVARDFALMAIVARLHGHERFSGDIDATRVNPPKQSWTLPK